MTAYDKKCIETLMRDMDLFEIGKCYKPPLDSFEYLDDFIFRMRLNDKKDKIHS